MAYLPAFIAQRIGAADTKIASGRLRAGGNDILVGVDAELDSVERIASIPLVMANNGSTLRVSDIATVRKTQLDPPRSLAYHGTEQVIFVNAKMQGGLQIENWTRNANALVAKFEANLPNSIGLETVYSQNIYTDQRMNSSGQQPDLRIDYCAAGSNLAYGHSLSAYGGYRPTPFRQHGVGGHAGVRYSVASNVGHGLDYFLRSAHR